jgi:hypothetical protein
MGQTVDIARLAARFAAPHFASGDFRKPPGTQTMSIRLWRHATGRWRQDSGRPQPASCDSTRPPVPGPAARGHALVELAFVVPILFFLSLAAIDLGRVFYSLITVTNRPERTRRLRRADQPMTPYIGRAPDAHGRRRPTAATVRDALSTPFSL